MYESIDALTGHSFIKSCLKKLLIKNAFPQTLLFEGPAGVGKAVFAKTFAKELLEGKVDLDLRSFSPEGKTCIHSISRMQELIKEAKLPPFQARRKVFIIYEAERMLPSSANALLKTLEEPLDDIIIILVSSNPERMLKTIISRALSLKFSFLTDEEVSLYFQKEKNCEPQKARRLSLLARGTLLKADLLLSQESETFLNLIIRAGVCGQHRDFLALENIVKQIEKGLEEMEGQCLSEITSDLLTSTLYFYRDLHLMDVKGDEKFLFFQNKKEELKSSLKFPLPSLEQVIKKIENGRSALDLSLPIGQVLPTLFVY